MIELFWFFTLLKGMPHEKVYSLNPDITETGFTSRVFEKAYFILKFKKPSPSLSLDLN
jgi:hypothetical protein